MAKATFFNFTKWPSENRLFIIGIPGVGKTTFANKLTEFDYAEVIHVDDYQDKIVNRIRRGEYLEDVFKKIKKRTVIEGVSLLYTNQDWLCTQPIIIIECSFLERLYRYIKRKVKTEKRSIFYAIYHGIRLGFKWGKKISTLKTKLGEKKYVLSKTELNIGVLPSKQFIENSPPFRYY